MEGFLHTHDRRKYGQNLLLFALIPKSHGISCSAIPGITRIHRMYFLPYFWVILDSVRWRLCGRSHCCSCYVLPDSSVSLFVLHADYSWHGFLLILIMYLLRTQKFQQALVSTLWMNYEWKMCFPFISINMYN